MKEPGTHKHLIRSIALTGFLPLLEKYKISAEPLLSRVGLSIQDLEQTERFISAFFGPSRSPNKIDSDH